ncbi:MAG TPA: MBL fold metallo-hydrolase [Ktedonobacteraceae bacterium]|nr:MBL fold metallo-hydrolase [Ktedonobacteraceae bacterium]
MRVTSLGSGSSGNALLVEAGPQRRTKLLIDAGFPGRTLARRLQQVGVTPERLQGICVTHEHTDHVIGLPWLAKHSAAPIISDPRTLAVLKRQFATGISYSEYDIPVSLLTGSVCEEPTPYYAYNGGSRVEPEPFELPELPEQGANFKSLPLDAGARRVIGDIEIISFPVSHDAVAPCGYLLSASGCRVCVVIDSGVVTEAILTAIDQADLLVIESNHDRERLLRGPYPQSLKQRILSSTGHLSNDQAADAILYTWRSDSVRWLWLSHLSRTNNTPGLAFNHLRQRLTAAKANLSQAHISVLPPGMGQTWDSTLLWQSRSLWEM